MSRLSILALFLLLASCSSHTPTNFGEYGANFRPDTPNLRPVRDVGLYEYSNPSTKLRKKIADTIAYAIRDQGVKLVGTARVVATYYDPNQVKSLARAKGADVVVVELVSIGTRTIQVPAYQVSLYYGIPQVQLPPPPQGGLLQSIADYELRMQQIEYMKELRRRNTPMEKRSVKVWRQDLVFLRTPKA